MAALVASSNTPVTGRSESRWKSFSAETNCRSELLESDSVPPSWRSREILKSRSPEDSDSSDSSLADEALMKPYLERKRWKSTEKHCQCCCSCMRHEDGQTDWCMKREYDMWIFIYKWIQSEYTSEYKIIKVQCKILQNVKYGIWNIAKYEVCNGKIQQNIKCAMQNIEKYQMCNAKYNYSMQILWKIKCVIQYIVKYKMCNTKYWRIYEKCSADIAKYKMCNAKHDKI